MNNENHQLKIKLMSSIMKDPKLSKQFRDAFSAPVGSTKREQAKNTLSIMKKVGGLRNDGQGGIMDNVKSFFGGSNNSSPTPKNYGNMVVFPSAPAFKTPISADPTRDYSKMGLTLGAPSSNTGSLTKTPNSYSSSSYTDALTKMPSSKNLFGSSDGSTSVNGVVIPKEQQTLNTDPFQSMFKSPVKTLTPTNPLVNKDLGINLHQATPVNITSLSGLSATRPGVSMSDELMKEYFKPRQHNIPPVNVTPPTNETNAGVEKPDILRNLDKHITVLPQNGASRSFNIAANSVASILKLTPETPLSNVDIKQLAAAIATNEGYFNGTSKIAIANNNPGNLKFANQKGATQDSRGFAVFNTPQEGADALVADLTHKFNSGNFSTINDLMSVYSPDSDNPASSTYGTNQNNGAAGYTGTNIGSKTGINTSGPYAYASDLAKLSFGGKSLPEVISYNNQLYKDSLEPLEIQLSNLKTQSENFVPTLTSYIKGKDKYSKAIDKMIESAEGDLLSVDMSDPASVDRYNNYTNYLYTLKRRQNERYGNYLNSAIKDYEAHVTKVQDNYDRFKTNATEILNNQNTIDKATYDDIMARGAEQWNALDNAETKAYKFGILKQQYYANGGDAVANGLSGANGINKDYYKDLQTYAKQYTIDEGITNPNGLNGTLDFAQLPENGLVGYYAQNIHQGGDEAAITEFLRVSLGKTIASNSNNPKKIAEIKKLINDLASYELAAFDANGGDPNASPEDKAPLASAISGTTTNKTQSAYEGYIKSNISTVKDAVSDLISNSGGFLGIGKKKPGLEDKETWLKKYNSLSPEFLETLFDSINTVYPASGYNQKDFLDQVFPGPTDEENATSLAKVL